jgi:hypothetical protein
MEEYKENRLWGGRENVRCELGYIFVDISAFSDRRLGAAAVGVVVVVAVVVVVVRVAVTMI